MPRRTSASRGGLSSAPRLRGRGPWPFVCLFGALFIAVVGLEAWARRAESRVSRETLTRLIAEREVALREELRTAIGESAETTAARARGLARRLDEGQHAHQAFQEDTLRRISGLDGEAAALWEAVDRMDLRSDQSEGEIATIQQELRTLGDRVHLNRPMALRFKEIQRENQESIFFVYSEISLRDGSGALESTIGTYGTGFLISEDGHIATSKHVAQPWKFRDFARQIALRGLEIDPESYLIAAWRSGSAFMDPDGGKLDLTSGYNNAHLGNLEVCSTAVDRYKTEVLEDLSGGEVEVRYQDPHDNRDLVLLKLDGGPFRPVKITPDASPEKLDPVMVLGFPRGLDILEKGVAETSPSLGTVRKVEDTIYVTASIIPGNSGGPVFDRDGNVIGVATRVVQGTETLGICLKMDHLLELVRLDAAGNSPPDGQPPVITAQRATH